MSESIEEILSRLLTGAVQTLDLPQHLYETAVDRYEEVGTWLAKTGDDYQIYPQGSFRLGTVVRPSTGTGSYDIDLVCRREIGKESTTQAELKQTVGERLGDYMQWKADQHAADGPSSCQPGRRCWTLDYPGHGFHMDVLPAIPDAEGTPTSILLTDVHLRAWQHSDPIGYATWFRNRSAEMLLRLTEAARALGADVADVPEWRVRTTLQRLVQVLKWHCGVRFADDPDNRPPSILITTLAGHAYRGETDLFTATFAAVQRMPDFVEYRAGRWWVPNPVHSKENFADKWNEYPERRAAFVAWLREISDLLEELGRMRGAGLDRITARLSESFSPEPIRAATRSLGDEWRRQREAGRLYMAAGTGALTTTAADVPVRNHTFYGDPTSPPRA